MDLGLENKVALVAGGSSGFGLASALELAREGAHVAIGAREPERLGAAERRLKDVARGRVHTTSVDITDEAAARRWVDELAAEFGALHIVLVSGAGPPAGPASAFQPADYRAACDTVLMPAVTLALGALPHLRAAGWGRLLFVTSETVHTPQPMLSLSGMARAAIVRFAQTLAADLGREGITVNVLAPGATRTPMVERAAARLAGEDNIDDGLALIGAHSAVGRLGTEDEFAAVAAFLASERASFVTGGVHLVDGGASVSGLEHTYLRTGRRETFT
ncbi:SDR family NAD(P)-dependent oxidoreductase [Actinophytocola sp.]|uniref:SDR family NAD(P)-dependent oxidoreductase n=1 Tax=Actinophytocola sp. TaxID=1872138 RepID=UPI003D6B2C89